MSDKEIKRKLNQLVKIANALDTEAKRRFGDSGNIFFESGGRFHLMVDDHDGPGGARQEFVRFSSDGHCLLGAGAW